MQKIAGTYHAWRTGSPLPLQGEGRRGEGVAPVYEDEPGFCKSASLEEIRAHDFVLTPGRYVGLGDLDEDDKPFEEKIGRLASNLERQFEDSDKLTQAILKNLNRFSSPMKDNANANLEDA